MWWILWKLCRWGMAFGDIIDGLLSIPFLGFWFPTDWAFKFALWSLKCESKWKGLE